MVHTASIFDSPFRSTPGPFGRPARVLLGLASAEARGALTCELKKEGYQVEHAFSGPEMKARLFFESFELVIYDARLSSQPVLDALFDGHAPQVIIVAPAVPPELNEEARRLKAIVVDPFVAARDVCDCAVSLVAPYLSAEGNALVWQG